MDVDNWDIYGIVKRVIITTGVVFLLLVIGGVVLIVVSARSVAHHHGALASLNLIEFVVSEYIEISGGDFPGSEGDLIAERLLKKEAGDKGVEYYFWAGSEAGQGWRAFFGWEEFEISYGVEPNDIEISGGRLVDKDTDEPVLLVEGPEGWDLHIRYAKVSVRWFELIQEERGKRVK
ncbi:MAG: hypothetical protein GY869_01940 [Planctomycetes bacterium]|nr:hypothetical protein [Planctomycetota bacterium]